MPTASFLINKGDVKNMKKNIYLTKTMIMFCAFLITGSSRVFAAGRYSAVSIAADNPERPYEKTEETVDDFEALIYGKIRTVSLFLFSGNTRNGHCSLCSVPKSSSTNEHLSLLSLTTESLSLALVIAT